MYVAILSSGNVLTYFVSGIMCPAMATVAHAATIVDGSLTTCVDQRKEYSTECTLKACNTGYFPDTTSVTCDEKIPKSAEGQWSGTLTCQRKLSIHMVVKYRI